MKRLVLIGLVFAMFFAIGCSGGGGSNRDNNNNESNTPVVTDSISGVIGTDGGTLTTPSGNTTLDVPAGALTDNTEISISQSVIDKSIGALQVPYDFSPSGLVFNVPAIVTLGCDSSLYGVDGTQSQLAYELNGQWVPIFGSTINTTGDAVNGSVNHFSSYACVNYDLLDTNEGNFNGVIVYSNNHCGYYNPPDPHNNDPNNIHPGPYSFVGSHRTGEQWQCVEYISRYYWLIYNHDVLLDPNLDSNSAWNFWGTAEKRGLLAYSNGGSVKPMMGDIVVFQKDNSNAHVAIVRSIAGNMVYIAQQNWYLNKTDANAGLNYNPNTNYLQTFNDDKSAYKVKGWLRLPGLRVRVISSHYYSGISRATVVLGNPDGTMITYGATDSNGEITFTTHPANATVTAAAYGYVSVVYDVNVPSVTLTLPSSWQWPWPIGTATINVSNLPANVVSWTLMTPSTANGTTNGSATVNIYEYDFQNDNTISFVVYGYDANNNVVAYSAVMDLPFTNGMTVNISNWSTNPATATYVFSNVPSSTFSLETYFAALRKSNGFPNDRYDYQPLPSNVTFYIPPAYGTEFVYGAEVKLGRGGSNDPSLYFARYSKTFSDQAIDFNSFPSMPVNMGIANAQTNNPVFSWNGTAGTGDAISIDAGDYKFMAPTSRTSIVFPELPDSLANLRPAGRISYFRVTNADANVIQGYDDSLIKNDQIFRSVSSDAEFYEIKFGLEWVTKLADNYFAL